MNDYIDNDKSGKLLNLITKYQGGLELVIMIFFSKKIDNKHIYEIMGIFEIFRVYVKIKDFYANQ